MAITNEAVRRIFAHLESGSGEQFFQHVADDVDWTVEGTHPLARRATLRCCITGFDAIKPRREPDGRHGEGRQSRQQPSTGPRLS
jgi:ketosteroid isomerase-like protein